MHQASVTTETSRSVYRDLRSTTTLDAVQSKPSMACRLTWRRGSDSD